MTPNYTDPAARPQVSPQASRAHWLQSLRTMLKVARLQEARVPFLRRSTRPDGFRDGMEPGGLQSGCQCQRQAGCSDNDMTI